MRYITIPAITQELKGLAFEDSAYICNGNESNKINDLTGVDVMITIFCDFCQFSAKNWRFHQKPML
jgi:hypothetical protein